MRYIRYALYVIDSVSREKRIYHISVREESRWAVPSKVLTGFFIDHPEFDAPRYRIALHQIDKEG